MLSLSKRINLSPNDISTSDTLSLVEVFNVHNSSTYNILPVKTNQSDVLKQKNMRTTIILCLGLLMASLPVRAQNIYNQTDDESSLYASTKQVNQFIRRFNGEENFKGERLYPKDKKYRNQGLRKTYLTNLFDLSNSSLQAQKKAFISQVNSSSRPEYFDFYGGNWFAEVSAKFLFNGRMENVVMFLKLEKETGGYKWSYSGVYAGFFESYFKTTPPEKTKFIHPMSHEVDFMSLRKVFKNSKKIEHYAHDDYSPDYLSLFFYEIKKGKLVFQSITEVKFHVFQINNWYFEMKYFNRKGDNTGWLISNLIKIPEKDKASLIKSISHEN